MKIFKIGEIKNIFEVKRVIKKKKIECYEAILNVEKKWMFITVNVYNRVFDTTMQSYKYGK